MSMRFFKTENVFVLFRSGGADSYYTHISKLFFWNIKSGDKFFLYLLPKKGALETAKINLSLKQKLPDIVLNCNYISIFLFMSKIMNWVVVSESQAFCYILKYFHLGLPLPFLKQPFLFKCSILELS